MPVEFKDTPGRSAHDAFQRWRRQNPKGYFLAMRTDSGGMLHRSLGCWHPGNANWRLQDGGGHSLTRKAKVCAATSRELLTYAGQMGLSVAECAHCRPDYHSASRRQAAPAENSPVNHEHRAARVWAVLTKRASAKKTVTYKELAQGAGGFHHRALRFPLGLIQDFCLEEKLPPITSLVVHGGDARPGRGFIAWDADDLETAQRLSFAFDWGALANPFGYAADGTTEDELAERLIATPESAEDVYQLVKVRGKAQSVFREALLRAYDWACAFCGLTFTEALDAAHILPWARCSGKERMSVNNGILLCSNHHEMFDADWLRIDETYRVLYTDMDREHGPYSATDERMSVALNGKKMALPADKKLWPNPKLIRERYGKRRTYG